MENSFKNQELIDKYLLGHMSIQEKLDFENQLVNNPDLSKELELNKLIVNEIEERAGFFHIMNDAEKKGADIATTKKKFIAQLTTYSAAASILILLTLGIWQPTKLSNSEINREFAVPVELPGKSNQIKKLEEGINGQDGTLDLHNSEFRGNVGGSDECEYGDFSQDECLLIREALQLYNEGKFEEACPIFESVLAPLQRNFDLSLLMAYSQFKSGQLEKADSNFIYLHEVPDNKVAQQAYFYLALVNVEKGNLRETRKILKEIKTSGGMFSSKASVILKKMRWF